MLSRETTYKLTCLTDLRGILERFDSGSMGLNCFQPRTFFEKDEHDHLVRPTKGTGSTAKDSRVLETSLPLVATQQLVSQHSY